MEVELHVIATIVGIVGTLGFILHRMKTEQSNIVAWRTRLETEQEHLKAAMQTYNERLRKHGEESDDVRETVHCIKKDIAVLRTRIEQDIPAIKAQLEKMNGHHG